MIGWFRRHLAPLGVRGEAVAAKALRRAGYKILSRNTRIGRYEIDIIAQEGDTIAFVEVKTRHDNAIADPDANVTHTKRQHIRRAARRYIAAQNDPNRYYRFDVVAVLLPDEGKPEVTIYRDAFPDE